MDRECDGCEATSWVVDAHCHLQVSPESNVLSFVSERIEYLLIYI